MGSPDIAVIGAGIVGLAAAHELRRRGASVTVYESGRPGHGQSAGSSRIFRHGHADPRMIDYAVESREAWRRWEDEFGTRLIAPDGALSLGPGASSMLAALAEREGIDASVADATVLAERLPVLAAYEGPGLVDMSGGSIDTIRAISSLTSSVGDGLVGDVVLSVRPLPGGGVEVRAANGCRNHDAAVVAAGRGTQALARGAGLSLPVESRAHVRVSFAPRSPLGSLATLQDTSGAFGEAGVYAAAYPDRSAYGVGLAEDVPTAEDGAMLAPDGLAEHVERVIDYVKRALPGLDPDPVGFVHCWATRLPWGDDGVAVWTAGDIAFLAGHNLFKHAPALGRELAATVLDGEVPELLRPEARFGRA
ncbi:amino acid oxidase [Aeromicrobium sp. PE09-221]|uniref:NAD(P)/FAD-dependent oxidoreductase n=1 Tax=Aeromicrobium sp. PE09-221 TaxID=1898043 RepID=UPI000B3E65D3|nr:FAD-dependent oxidoreductase [Aeromicrobium sp. PE09-221]OUZ07852.1 amino acid oxidase [Aeromicrobium sp. PE09-221]